MHLCWLPNPIIIQIAGHLSQHDLNCLVQTNHHFYNLLLKYLYSNDIQDHNRPHQAILHHCRNGHLRALHGLFTAICTLDPQTQFLWNHWLCFFVKNPFSRITTISPSAQRTNPLHEAVENGHLAIAEYLLFEQDFRADDRSREVSNGETALTIAASRGDLEMVKLLLRAGADIFYSPPAATGTALDQSARNGQWHVAQFLLAEMKRRIYERTPDDVYAEHGGLFASREFQLQRLENSITVRILEGDFAPLVRQALGAAIRVRDAELVDALLSDTVLEIIAGETGAELLCDAVDAHSAEMVQLLLRHGADPNAMTSSQWYAWNATLRAAARGEVEIVQVLVEGGGDPDIQDWEGRTPLSYAAERGHVGVVRLLLGYGVDVFSRDAVRGWRALDWAVQEGMTGVVEILEPLTQGGLVSLLEDSTM